MLSGPHARRYSDEFVKPLLHHVGKSGQLLGLGLPAIAILLELNRTITLGQMLVMLVAAVCCFSIGRILEGYSRT